MSDNGKGLMGKVVSNRMAKTVVVVVERRVADTRFGKIKVLEKRFKAHDEKKQCQVGDQVWMVSCRPLSRDKKWRVTKVLRRGVDRENEL